MQTTHTPVANTRYWAAITLASVLGTNFGDLYAHESGLGLIQGLGLLLPLFLLVLWAERRDATPREAYYWTAIVLVRTAATNIADFAAYKAHIHLLLLTAAMGLLLALLVRPWKVGPTGRGAIGLGNTSALYWAAMLTAGTFGTALGDYLSIRFGLGPAGVGLGLFWGAVWLVTRHGVLTTVLGYWCAIALVRTAGTSIGDFLAENPRIGLGLPGATVCSLLAFVAVLTLWRSADAKGSAARAA